MKLEAAKLLDTQAWHDLARSLKYETRNLIDGRFVDSKSGRKFNATNPVDNSVIAEISRSNSSDVDLAVATSRKTFRSGVWSRMAPRQRMEVMYRFTDLVANHAAEFAALDVLNVGKPVQDMLNADVPGSILALQYFSECIDKINGLVTPTALTDLQYIVREPIGVVACIVPWNYPLMMAVWKVAPALATGNSVILKPAEQSPLSANLLAKLFLDAGGPAGVFNVIHGLGEEVGKALGLHNDVDKVAFTGSTEVGRSVMEGAAATIKRVTLELGGKSANVVFADADLEKAAAAAPYAVFDNAGQDCCARSRILVERSTYDRFADLLVTATRKIKVGDPSDESTEMGPLISAQHRETVASFVEGEPLYRGDTPTGKGYWYPCTIVEATNDDRIAREEVFGPVAALIPFEDEADAIRIANDTPYGLSGSIWTQNGGRALRVARALETGVLSVNSNSSVRVSTPFGGFKQSGFGRELGMHGLDGYSEVKNVYYSTEG